MPAVLPKPAKQSHAWKLILLLPTLVLAFCSLTLPMTMACGGGEAKSSEARAALGTIKDRLRTRFIQNGNRVDPHWRLADLVNVSELSGKYYGADDYVVDVPITAGGAVFRALANTATNAPQVTLTITNIQTGSATLTSP